MRPRKHRWPTTPKMPRLVDGKITAAQLVEAFTVLDTDGPETPMTLKEVIAWLELHVDRPHPPAPSQPPGTRGVRRPPRRREPAGRPGRHHPAVEAVAA